MVCGGQKSYKKSKFLLKFASELLPQPEDHVLRENGRQCFGLQEVLNQ